MAIASVARSATVKEDRSVREALQILGQQQARAGQLALQQKKADRELQKQKNEETSKQFKALRDIDSPYSPHNEQFQKRQDAIEQTLLNPEIPFLQKEKQITDLAQFSKSSLVVKGAIIKNSQDRVGTEAQRKLRNEDEIAIAQVGYIIGPDGEPIPPEDFNQQKLDEAVDTNLATYNVPNTVKAFMDQQKDIVATETSSKNLSNGFTENKIIDKMAKFLVLLPDKSDWERDPDGKPTTNLTGETLEAFEAFSDGNSLAIDAFLAKSGNKGKSRLDGMKNVLEENGWLTSRETIKTSLVATPKPSAAVGSRQVQIATINQRIDLFQESLNKDGGEILSQLKTGKGVIDEGTKVERTKTGMKFTIKIDLNQLKETPFNVAVLGSLSEEEKRTVGEFLPGKKKPKIITRVIEINNANPLPGYVELSAVWDQTVGSKFEIDPVLFTEEFKKRQGGRSPFDASLTGEQDNPFGFNIK